VTRARQILSFMVRLICLAAAMTFLIWVVNSSADQMPDVPGGLNRYTNLLPLGASIGVVIFGIMYLFGAQDKITLLLQTSCLLYWGFLKFAGLPVAPWVLGALVIAAIFRYRTPPREDGSSMLLLHSMGTITGLYMSFHLHEFLSGWGPFTDVLASIWLVLTAPIS
jgi:hypothetical protein